MPHASCLTPGILRMTPHASRLTPFMPLCLYTFKPCPARPCPFLSCPALPSPVQYSPAQLLGRVRFSWIADLAAARLVPLRKQRCEKVSKSLTGFFSSVDAGNALHCVQCMELRTVRRHPRTFAFKSPQVDGDSVKNRDTKLVHNCGLMSGVIFSSVLSILNHLPRSIKRQCVLISKF